MSNLTVNDLKSERNRCSFNPTELTYLLDGGKKSTEERRAKENMIKELKCQSSVPVENLSHEKKYEETIKIACMLYKLKIFLPEHWGNWHEINPRGTVPLDKVFRDGNPFGVHISLFLSTLYMQGTSEQREKWLSRAWNFEIIGTYAQTELAHGTNIRALETTAVYNPLKQEFILNTPTFKSYKWWPGGLGHTANYAIVIAQLYTQGKCHGVHAFIVQLRNEDTHMPLPGIDVGEIGPKMGYNGANNGYLGLKNVKIPRMQMLMKNTQVLEDGTYVASANPRLIYGTMVLLRVLLVFDSAQFLKHASTIAARYSAVRRQCHIKASTSEVQVLDFVTQQYKIFPQIASTIAFHFTGDWLWKVYVNLSMELEKNEFGNLAEFHAMSCVLKAITTGDSSDGIETCRKACGGHGFLMSSGFPHLYGIAVPQITFEGENTVLCLQTARFLLKSWQNKEKLQGSKTVQYLVSCLDDDRPFKKSVDWILFAIRKTVTSIIESVSEYIIKQVTNGAVVEEAANLSSLKLVKAAELHGRACIVEIFYTAVKEASTSEELKAVLVQLAELYAVDTILKYSSLINQYNSHNSTELEILQEWLVDLLVALRPNAIGIVDGFDISDEMLGSALGSNDGKVYERIFEEAKKSPLNISPVNKSFDLYLKEFMKPNLRPKL